TVTGPGVRIPLPPQKSTSTRCFFHFSILLCFSKIQKLVVEIGVLAVRNNTKSNQYFFSMPTFLYRFVDNKW
ncbi:MAG: hypothetical protein ACOVKP_00090, partial [Flavobacterium sp.]